MIRSLVLIGLLLGASPALAQGSLPESFYGEWQGTEVTTNEHGKSLDVTAEDLNVRIEPDGDGFRMDWTALTQSESGDALERTAISARFAPTDRPGVFEFNPAQSSLLLSLFGDPATSNPLEGEPLLWARLDGDALSLYGLEISRSGGFDLYHQVRSLTDQGMAVQHTHRTERDQPVTINGLLQRVGG